MEKLILKGIAASNGIAEGIVKIVEGVKDISRFADGDILVAKITEPSMVIMMNKAAAIVTDKGGLTSHPAIVSRELGIPCVVNTQTATQTLKDGMKIKVDDSKGEIYIIE
ncbi:MAG: pyruvate, water dikinase [Parcubacteria group bacterium Licking1014_1]|nr:MAG: pyruvate, water dikinase [Parcubacteria group bacterium Licking1014_1]